MAVSVNVGAKNLRSDFMISDAAIPQRVEAHNKADKFEEMLAKADNKRYSDVKKAIDDGKFDVPTVEELEKAGAVKPKEGISDSPRELAQMIASGKADIDEIPRELLTPQLVEELMALENADIFSSDELLAKIKELLGADLTENIAPETDDNSESDSDKLNLAASLLSVDISDELSQLLKTFQSGEEQSELVGNVELGMSAAENQAVGEEGRDELMKILGGISENQAESTEKSGEETLFGDYLDEKAAAILQDAAENGEISKPEVRTVKAEKPENSEQYIMLRGDNDGAVSVKAVDERAKALSEELEMLKNAKQKPESEPKMQNSGGEVQFSQNIAESTVILRRDNGEMLVVSQKEVVSQVQKLVEQIISENREQNEYSLVLNPEELGKITVKMTKAADGAVSVTIVAENARTQRILEQNSELMQTNLKNSGVNLENWQTVNETQQNPGAQDYKGSAKNPYSEQENHSDEEQDEDGKSFADIIAAM